ncbi:MAG: DUF4397 domain-containing protein [Balneolales bacterium]|nr:DUF4397 domain-containing protein [Balneolales bacterium]
MKRIELLLFYLVPVFFFFAAHSVYAQQIQNEDNGIDFVFFEDFNDETLPEGWQTVNFGTEGREWIFLEPVEPVRLDGQIGTGYTTFEPFSGGIALAEAVGTFPGPTVHIGMVTPAIDVSGLDEVILRMDQQLRAVGTSFGRIDISTDGNSWQEVAVVTEAGSSVNNAPLFQPFQYDIFPETTEYNLTAFAAGESEVYLRFVFNDNGGAAFWWMLDNIGIYEPGPRPNPAVAVNPTDGAENIRLTTALEWVQGSGVTPDGYFLSFGTDNPPSNIEDMLDVGDANSYQPEFELEYSTEYFWQVIPYDALGIIDDEIEVFSFTTKDDPVVTEFPFNEIFEDATAPGFPLGWRFEDANGNGITWGTNSFLPRAGELAARVNFDANNPKDDWLFSPPFEFEAGVTYELGMWYTRGEFIAPRVEKLKVHLASGTSSDLVEEDPFFNDDNIISQIYIQGGSTFTVPEDGRYHLAFHAYSDANQRTLWLDDITVSIVPPDPDLVFEPESIDFGSIFVGAEEIRLLSFNNAGAEPLEITLEIENEGDFSLSETSITVEYNTIETVAVSFNPQQAGDLSTSISLTTNDPQQPAATIAVAAEALPAPEALILPDQLNFSLGQGDLGSETITLQNNGGSPLSFAFSSLPASEAAVQTQRVFSVKENEKLFTSPVDLFRSSAIAFEQNEAANEVIQNSVFTNGFVIQDSLFYDGPDLDPDVVVGIPNPDIPFWGATRFTAGDGGFYLTHIRNWFRTEVGQATVNVQIFRGGDSPATGQLLTQQNITVNTPNGASVLFEVLEPQLFDPGEDFWILFRFPNQILSPQGVDEGIEGVTDRFVYWFANEQEWIELPDPEWAYKMRAVSAGLDWIEMDPLTGTTSPDSESEVMLTVNPQGLDVGTYNAFINIATNDPLAPLVSIPLQLEVTDAGPALAQIVHNAADPALQSVDVFVNGDLAIPELTFRTATSYLELPAGEIEVALASAGEGLDAAVYTTTLSLNSGQAYQVFATGMLDPAAFPPNPEGLSTAFDLYVLDTARTEADAEDKVDTAVFHGATDAPAVSISSSGATLVNEAAFGEFAGYLELDPDAYTLVIAEAFSGDELARFNADLSMLDGEALTVMASGFLDPSAAGEERAFGLFAVLASGQVVALENVTSLEPGDELPTEVALEQNYPNPFNPVTQITYGLPETANVTLEVFNLQGQRVAVLVNGQQTAGTHTVQFDGSRLASGMYMYRLQTGSVVQVRKMMLVK